jgi:putative transposase
MMVRFIDAYRDAYGVEPIGEMLPIALSRYYNLRGRQRDPARAGRRGRAGMNG